MQSVLSRTGFGQASSKIFVIGAFFTKIWGALIMKLAREERQDCPLSVFRIAMLKVIESNVQGYLELI